MLEKFEKRLEYLKGFTLTEDEYIIGYLAGRIAELESVINFLKESKCF